MGYMYRSICQSCSMPLRDYNRGSEADGSLSNKYCNACFIGGEFTEPDISLSAMEDQVAGILHQRKHWPMVVAKVASRQIVNLERWSKDALSQNGSANRHIYH
jgi:hypothetical protein